MNDTVCRCGHGIWVHCPCGDGAYECFVCSAACEDFTADDGDPFLGLMIALAISAVLWAVMLTAVWVVLR